MKKMNKNHVNTVGWKNPGLFNQANHPVGPVGHNAAAKPYNPPPRRSKYNRNTERGQFA